MKRMKTKHIQIDPQMAAALGVKPVHGKISGDMERAIPSSRIALSFVVWDECSALPLLIMISAKFA
jgi:hypothetical protein